MESGAWFESLADALAGMSHGDATASSAVDGIESDERALLLDLARIAAHTSERWTAPITTYAIGIALAELPTADRVAALRGLVERLEGAASSG